MQNKIKNKIQNLKKYVLTNLLPHQLTTSSGFTLIETLVAITILLLSITGPLQIAANALLSTYYTRDQITAYYLATEAIEYVKNVRDTTFLEDVFGGATSPNVYWLHNLEECIAGGDPNDFSFTGCYIDIRLPLSNPDAIKACSSSTTGTGECPPLRINSNTGFWSYDTSNIDITDSKFTRRVELRLIGGNEAVINVKITWPSLSLTGAPKVFEIDGFIMNWERI